jgi:predicted amidohydrolase
MRISCVLNAQEARETSADLIVFPEGVSRKEIKEAYTANPDSIIVGAVVENGRSKGLLMYQHQNKINYLKVESDGRTEGSNNIQQNPIYEMPNICIGVLICRDVDHVEFACKVIDQIKSSNRELKVLCVPADMGSYWFSNDILEPKYEGVNVVLCNHTKTYQPPSRCQSFVTDIFRNKIKVQNKHEPISIQLSMLE